MKGESQGSWTIHRAGCEHDQPLITRFGVTSLFDPMKTVSLLLSVTAAAAWLGWVAPPAQAQPPIPGPAYARSIQGPPWGVSANESAMDRVFGAGGWRDLSFETLNVPQFLAESTFIFLEGSDQGAQAMENFLTAHASEIENWVSGGGVLFLNAAPNVGDGMSFLFGVTLLYSDWTGVAHAGTASHPIFNEPFMPVGTSWNGSIGHATVSGPGLLPLIANSENGHSVLAEKAVGNGWVIFGGMTTDNFHSPQPEAQNLRANILAYASGQISPPTNLPPVIQAHPASQAVLAGDNVTLRSSARGSRPLSFQWFFNGQPLPGATNASLVLTSVTTNQAGGYKLVASNALGIATSDRATLTVSLQGPRITLHPSSRLVLAGEDVAFSVLATGGPLFYQWQHNGTDLPGATNASLFLSAVTTNHAGTYRVAVSNLLGYVTSLPAILTVSQFAPRITSQPFDQSVQSGDSVQFHVGADGAPLPAYQWRFNNVDLPGETNATLFLPNVTTSQAGIYSVVVANLAGSMVSDPARLTVNDNPPSIWSQPFSQTVNAGGEVGFFVGVNGSPPLTFQWRHNGTNIPGATNQSLILVAVHPNRAGTYTVNVSNHLGFVASQPATLNVVGGAAPVFTAQPANLTLLAGGNATLLSSASGQPAPAYQWRFNGQDLPGATLSFLALANVATNQAGNYTVVASNLLGAVTSRVAVVTVNVQAPIISVQPLSRTADAGSTVSFSVLANAGPPPVYQWFFNSEALPGAQSSLLVLSNVFTNHAGVYTVIVSNELDAVLSAPATLTVNGSAPVITAQPASRTVLDGSNATFAVTATGIPQVRYQWLFNGIALPGQTTSSLALSSVNTNAAGEYTVVVSNLFGAIVSEPAILTVTQQAPVIAAQTTNRTVAVGANVLFQVLAVAGPRPTYQWQHDGVNIAGATGSSIILSNVTHAQAGIYAVVVSNPLGTVTSQPMRLTVVYQPPIITGNPTNRSVLAGGTASFAITTAGTAPFFYQWRLNGSALPGATNQILVLTGVMTNQAGSYSVVVTNFGGAATSSVATLTVTVQPPVITTQPANRTVPGGTNVTFTVVANGAPAPTYQWRHNGVELAGATNAQLIIPSVGTNHAGGYSVIVRNPFGSITSRVATLTVILQLTTILVQPADRTVRPGGTITFSVSVSGTPPLLYQWDFNGQDIPGATNSTHTVNGVTPIHEGSYRVTIVGAGGTVVSREAVLTISELASGDFQIAALLASNSRLVEHNFVTGDDRGGIAASGTHVFYSGDSQTAGFALEDLSGGTGAGRIFDALVGELKSQTVYSLGNGTTPLGGGGTVTTLIELNHATAQPGSNVITLSESLDMQNGSGIFAGYDQIALFNGTRVYSIELPSGQVIDHGPFAMPPHAQCENWAFWGVAEQIGGELHLAYVRDFQTIARVRVADGVVEPIATLSSLSDMCSFTLSLPLNRWYFHHEGVSQFGGGDEGIGYADAIWEASLPGPPVLWRQPQSLTVVAGRAAEFSVAAIGTQPLSYRWQFNGEDIVGATARVFRLDRATTNDSGSYRVVVSNTLGVVTSSNATLNVSDMATVAVFDDPFYVDTSGGSGAESDSLQASLRSLGYGVSTFTDIETATAANVVLVFPELEANYLPGALSQATRAALAEFVDTGGSIILHGVPQAPGWSADLLNGVFGFGVQELQELDGTLFARTAQAGGTAFAAGGTSLPANRGSTSLLTNSLPPGALSIYEESGRSLVALLPHGLGRIIFLGWDWNNASPLGTADNGWLDVLAGAMTESGVPSPGTNRPPFIVGQPASRTTLRGSSVTFRVAAGGSQPLAYQWQFNGLHLPGATNATLVLADVEPGQSGTYVAVVSNAFGSISSASALLSVVDAPANVEFRITSLTANNSLVAEHDLLTGDDRGGIAVSGSHVFYSGDDSTARFALADLSGGTRLGRIYDAMVSNLRTETMYSLGAGLEPIPQGGGTVTTLIEIEETGELTTNSITLSTPITVGAEAGIFAGYDQVVLLTGGRAYSIQLPGGLVTDLGAMNLPDHQGCENWAFWGVAENFDGAVHLVYVRDSQAIVRTRVPDLTTEVLATFDNLSDMCSFTLSLSLNRWYFHHEGSSQFGGSSETIGFADASWEFPVPPLPPGITQPPQNVDGLWGGSALLKVVAAGPLLRYQWQFNGAALPGASAPALLLSNLTGSDAGSYAVVVSNPFGSVTSAPVALTVSALAPTVTTPPASQTVVLGVDVLFAAEITAAPQAALQWFFNNAALPGATNATLLLTNVTLGAAGSYRIVADNFAGSAISPAATLTVLPQVPLPVALDTPGREWTTGGDAFWAGQPFAAHDGVDAAQSGFLFDDEVSWLQTTVIGPGQVSFWWKVFSELDFDFLQFSIDGVEAERISGDVDWQRQTITLPSGERTLRWSYVKDGSVSEGADRAWLDEVRFDLAPRIVTQPASRTVAETGTATFSVEAEGSAPLTYQWRRNGAPVPQATNASLSLVNVRTEDNGSVYSVVVSNGSGSVTSSNATLFVVSFEPVVVGIHGDGESNERDALAGTLTNLGFAVRFITQGQWGGLDVAMSFPGGSIGPSHPEISSGVNYVQISDWGSSWTPNNVRSIPGGANVAVRVDATHPITDGLAASWTTRGFWHYGFPQEDYVGWSTDSALPSLVSEVGATIQPRLLVANSIGDGRAVYIGWNVYGPAANPNDVALLRNAISWAAGTPVVPTPPLIVQQPGSQTIPAGSAAAFAVVARGTTPLSYQWQFNGASIPDATNATLSLGYVLPANAGDYTVVISNPLGTVTSDPATLAVMVQAPVITTQPASQSVLGGGSVALSVTASGVPSPTYQWKRDGVDIPGATNSTLALNDVTLADAGSYKVIVRNFAGNATSLPARLTVNILPPQITLQPASQTVLRGTNVTFAVVATGAPAPSYQWRFNGTNLTGETNPSLTIHQPTPSNAGLYTVRVSNSGGAVISMAAELTVIESVALAEALDLPGLLWRSGGGASWFGQPMISRDGMDAASSGGTSDSRDSWLETTVTGPGTVSFWWKVSSELGFDQLTFSVGSAPLAAISGETEWQALSFTLSDGPQTLRWSYAKDGSFRDRADAGWVDQVMVTTTPALVIHAAIVGADVKISFPSAPGRRYRVQHTDGLSHFIEWQPVSGAENVLGTGLRLDVLDAAGAGSAQRFYRVLLLP
jgi:hypothetical protein